MDGGGGGGMRVGWRGGLDIFSQPEVKYVGPRL